VEEIQYEQTQVEGEKMEIEETQFELAEVEMPAGTQCERAEEIEKEEGEEAEKPLLEKSAGDPGYDSEGTAFSDSEKTHEETLDDEPMDVETIAEPTEKIADTEKVADTEKDPSMVVTPLPHSRAFTTPKASGKGFKAPSAKPTTSATTTPKATQATKATSKTGAKADKPKAKSTGFTSGEKKSHKSTSKKGTSDKEKEKETKTMAKKDFNAPKGCKGSYMFFSSSVREGASLPPICYMLYTICSICCVYNICCV
jgi:hypothetical protein